MTERGLLLSSINQRYGGHGMDQWEINGSELDLIVYYINQPSSHWKFGLMIISPTVTIEHQINHHQSFGSTDKIS